MKKWKGLTFWHNIRLDMPAQKYTVTFGGWYQRITLHLSEIYGFLEAGFSKLDLSKDKLAKYHTDLDLEEVSREVESLEFVKAKTASGIDIRYYEDGLYILQVASEDIDSSQRILSKYFEEIFEPAISYIFSLGAPTPKVLANIKTYHPTVVSLKYKDPKSFKLEEKYGEVYSQISSEEDTVYKTPGYIFVVTSGNKKHLRHLIETQIFFREYKDQLEKYLNIHRVLW